MGGLVSGTHGNKQLGEGKLSTHAIPPLVFISDSINIILQWMWKRQVPSKYGKIMQIEEDAFK